ncbi:aldose 1-epimerase [Ramlibacter sp. PS4R-6]|uniref:aldose 1-epimerase n=1 Tax=Ramlibacter sp. PS4R-6 TaxID=3133438 RepID=UPI0030AAE645
MVELRAGELICRIEPRLGGCVTQLVLGGEPVLRPAPVPLETARQSGSYPLVPFSNRIGGATLQWQGTLHPLVRNNGTEPHAIHGIGWQRAWQVLDSEPSYALLSFEHAADASWPFAFDASQTIRVTPKAAEFTLALTNQSGRDAPAGLGWHPFFVKRPGAQLAVKTAGRWEMGDDKLPTRRVANGGIAGDIAALDVDHCFDGWDGVAHLRDALFDIRVRSNLTRIVVFTTPARDHIAIEPVSHVNNALALAQGGDPAALGLVTLGPGETLSAQMTIEVERRA